MSVPMASLQPYIRQADEHQRLAYTGGAELAVILDGAITGGQLTVFDNHGQHGDSSPVRLHSRDDEAFLLLEGEMTVWVGDERHKLRPGGVASDHPTGSTIESPQEPGSPLRSPETAPSHSTAFLACG